MRASTQKKKRNSARQHAHTQREWSAHAPKEYHSGALRNRQLHAGRSDRPEVFLPCQGLPRTEISQPLNCCKTFLRFHSIATHAVPNPVLRISVSAGTKGLNSNVFVTAKGSFLMREKKSSPSGPYFPGTFQTLCGNPQHPVLPPTPVWERGGEGERERVWKGPKGGNRKVGGAAWGVLQGTKFRAFFFLLTLPLSLFFSLWGSSR